MNHYKVHKPEAIDLILKYDLNFIEGNIVKYILRSPFKGDRIGDLKKALDYAKKLPKQLLSEGKRADFYIDELDQYLDSHALYAVEVDAVYSVIQGNFFHTVTHNDLWKRILEYKENYIAKLIEIAIESRSGENKEFNPDWLPPHPLNTLLDLIDENPKEILSKLDKIEDRAIIEEKDNYYLDSIAYLICFIKGNIREIEILSTIGGSKKFWQNKYENYWEKRNQSVTK